jgi:Cu(I)/Ag(I) efflux system membrane protein CusA/SilA
VRVRYARANREDEESVKRLLVSGSGMAPPADATSAGSPTMAGGPAKPERATGDGGPLQVPLSQVADVRVVEGPATIRSENGQLMNYVTLNVRGRDMVGFVEEAQRVVAETVPLPEGVHVEWSGQFEH